MIPKKNKGADLEGKKSVFFLFGIALALTAAIYVIQFERGVANPVPGCPTEVAGVIDEPTAPRTVRTVEEMKKLVKVNPEMPPEVVPDEDPILEITKIFDNPVIADEPLEVIDGPNDLVDVETLDFIVMENIARPFNCEGITDKDAQKVCFNEWMQGFIANNTQYPELAKQIGLEGKVFVNFIISETGVVEEVSIARGEHEILNKEALRVLSSMPQMIPGNQRGRKAKMKMTVPVNFKLSDH